MNALKKLTLEKGIILLVVIIGLALSVIQFIYNRSLWGDEAAVALNIINKSHADLLRPMDYNQVAPILFLQIEKLFSELIPNSEYGLRLYPLLCFLLSLFLFFKILREVFHHYYTILLAISIFVFNATLIYYSSEVK